MNGKADHIWHVWLNEVANRQRGLDGPCCWCGKLFDEHGERTRHGRLCPVEGVTSQFFTAKLHLQTTVDPSVETMYAWKSAVQFMEWAPRAIKQAMEKGLPTAHRHCSHSLPEPIENNTLRCWLGQDVVQCPLLKSLKTSLDEQRKIGYYSDVTDDDVYQVMGYVCTWHMLMSSIATKQDTLPKPAFVDWNEGAFQDEGDRRFWSQVYESMSGGPQEEEPEVNRGRE